MLYDDARLPLLTGLLLALLTGLLLTLGKLLLALLPLLLQSCLLHPLEGVLTGLIVALGTEPARLLQVYGRTRGALLKALDELITWVLLLGLLLLGLLLLRGELLLALGLRRLARLHQLLRLLLLLLRRLHLRERCWNERGRSQQCRCDDHFHCCLPWNGG